jgi:FAD/FMN-containing dehydrogenase
LVSLQRFILSIHMLDFINALAAAIGPSHVLTSPEAMRSHLVEPRGLFHARALAVVKPGNTEEVAAVVRLARQYHVPIVPQGGNTGLVGGGVPDDSGQAIVLSLTRMNRVRHVDADNDALTVEAGATLASVQEAARAANRLFPLSLASEGSCTIGGNIATNAGGTAVLSYGNMRDLVLGLEVVLADGRIWNGLRCLRKDNSGYALKHLFIGSEGTLGIVTTAALRLFPRPQSVETFWAGVSSPDQALALFRHLRAHFGSLLTAAELLPQTGLDMVLTHFPQTRAPLPAPHMWHILFEVSSPMRMDLRDILATVLEEALEKNLLENGVIAQSLAQREAFWLLREAMSEAQKHEGGSIKHDISVPISALPEMIRAGCEAALNVMPGCRPVPFGHVGDGNLHFNISQPIGMDKALFLKHWDVMNAAIHALVAELGGSAAAEHGVGRLKADIMRTLKQPQDVDMMRAIKNAFDPEGLLNPGTILSRES